MGILADALSISFGILIGGLLKNKIKLKSNQYFAIAVMLISLLGFMENVFTVSGSRISGGDTTVIVLSLVAGAILGDALHLEERISNVGKGGNACKNGMLDAVFLFGIGGLQISGPILLAVTGDSSQLYLKAIVDFPLALLTGATYGCFAALCSLPVALMQMAVCGVAYLFGALISESLLMSLCAMGFVILFFTGLNMLGSGNNRIKNVNMVPGVLFVIIFHILKVIL